MLSIEGISAFANGNTLYVVDAGNHRIRAVNLANQSVSTIAGGAKGYKEGIGKEAQFDFGTARLGGIIASSDTRLFVADFWNYRIRVIEYK